MRFGRRTTVQLALLVMGLIVWAYGQRVDDARLRWIGIGCFAAGTMLRLFKSRHADASADASADADESPRGQTKSD